MMRIPRVRWTVRRAMILVAGIALGLFLWEEFQDGLPPRFVVRGVPARIARLRPGMSEAEVAEILGLEKSWLEGGTSARFHLGLWDRGSRTDTYLIRPMQAVAGMASIQGGPPTPVEFARSSAMIQLSYLIHPEGPGAGGGGSGGNGPDPGRLIRATFSNGSATIAEMPE